MKDFLSIGQIINTHGIKGEVKVYPLTDDVKRFKKLKTIYLDDALKEVDWCKLQNDRVILKINGIDTLDDAVKLKQKYIYVKREDAVELKKGSYFIADIIGCSVHDENGTDLGVISDVIKTGSNDVYVVKGSSELLVPALKDVVTDMDVENGNIIIKPVETWN